MNHVSIALLVIAGCVVGCFYGDPDYGDTHFACDADHPCPPGQECNVAAGTCGGGGSGEGVLCGSAGVCTTGLKCCTNPASAPSCIPVGTACATGASAECDSSADCGDVMCCQGDEGPVCLPAGCTSEVCVDQGDCSGGLNCCPVNPTALWGYCVPFACPT